MPDIIPGSEEVKGPKTGVMAPGLLELTVQCGGSH